MSSTCRAPTERAPDRFGAFAQRLDAPLGPGAGALEGRLVAIKEMVDVEGLETRCGLGPGGARATGHAPLVARLIAAGARIAGTTRMTPLAYEPSGANAIEGRPRNPWNAGMICGGSSSGSAVAVAAGLVPLALGSDTGGSLRIPAHCCGLAAWKPTHGALPLEGAMPLAPSLDTLGFLARGAADLTLLARALLPGGEAEPVRRLAHARDLTAASAPAIARVLEGAVEHLRELAPVTEIEAQPVLEATDAAVLTLLQGEAARSHPPDARPARRLDPTFAKRLAKGADIADRDLEQARARLAEARSRLLETLLATAEALVLPVMPIETPPVAECEPGDPAFSARTLYALSAFTRFVNGLGLPAIALPAGFDSRGMPVAIQLVGRPGADLALLAFAAALEARLTPRGFPPPPLSS